MSWSQTHRRFSSAALALTAVGASLLVLPSGPHLSAELRNPASHEIARHGNPAPRDPVHVLIVYYSMTGNTEKMAHAVAEGVQSVPGGMPTVMRSDAVTADDLRGADALVLGSPTYWGNIAGPMKAFIDDWSFKYKVPLVDKVGGAFASGGGETGGKEHVVSSLDLAMLNGGMILVGPIEGGLGAAGVTGVSPVDSAALVACRALGRHVADVALRVGGRS